MSARLEFQQLEKKCLELIVTSLSIISEVAF